MITWGIAYNEFTDSHVIEIPYRKSKTFSEQPPVPIEAELHKRHLSIQHNILMTTNETITELSQRQIAINLDNPFSYFCRVQEILDWELTSWLSFVVSDC